MDASVIETVRREEKELQRKLAAVQALLRVYGEQPVEASQEVIRGPMPIAPREHLAPVTPSSPPPARDKRSIEDFSPYGRQAIATSMRFLLGQTRPVKTRQLVDLLSDSGFIIRGESPYNALGALLGRSSDIVSHGKSGWTLADPERAIEIVGKYAHKENEPPSVSAGGSDAAGEGAPPPNPAQDQSYWGREA